MKVLFLDIDGVVLPGRAYCLPNQTNDPYVTVFDPCSVSLINELCKDQGFKIVLHSSWIRTHLIESLLSRKGTTVENHCIAQGLLAENFAEDSRCNGDISWRYDRVKEYLARHPEIVDYVIIDDDPPSETDAWAVPNFYGTDFDEGVTLHLIRKIANRKNKA